MTSWEASSLADEYESIEEILYKFDPSQVAAEVSAWTRRIKSKEIHVHDTYSIGPLSTSVSGTDAIAPKARSAPTSIPADIDPPPKQASPSATSLSVPPRMLRTRTTVFTITMAPAAATDRLSASKPLRRGVAR